MTLFHTHLTVEPAWIDHNGHMNVAYYVLAFDFATDAVYETWGVGEAYPQSSGCSVFTLGMDVDYLAELFVDDPITITTQLLDWDHKRIHYYHQMIHAETGRVTAVNECLAMNVHLETRRSTPFPEDVQQRLTAVYAEHQHLKKPANSAHRLAIRRETNSSTHGDNS
ncbi:MAG: thioesterase [Chloroflexi bacterium]|nr:thioesterase [Chloroflexota bacterium]